MIGIHPNRRAWIGACGFVLALGVVGCTNQQMSASNPFMAPDRVPPPATRTIAPGTAAPYYPGSPMPAAQTAPPAPPVAQTQPQFAPPVPNATMAMATPTALAPPPAASPSAPLPGNSVAFSNERSVAIPTDNQDLRFALPAPPVMAPAAQQPSAPTPMAATPAAASPVVPAAFNQPLVNQSAVPMPVPTADANTSGPWRSPQVPQSGSPVMQAQYVQPQAAPPPTLPTMLQAQTQQPVAPVPQSSPVELQPTPTRQAAPAGPPAPVNPAASPPPRMRFPSLLEPSTWFTPQPPAANQQLIGYMVPGPDGQMHMVSVEQYQASQGGGVNAPPAASVAGSDGFRPRGTSTK